MLLKNLFKRCVCNRWPQSNKKIEMKTFFGVQVLGKIVGLGRSDRSSWSSKILRHSIVCAVFILHIIMFVAMHLYIVRKTDNAIDAVDSMAPGTGFILGFGQYFFISLERNGLHKLYDEIQSIVDESSEKHITFDGPISIISFFRESTTIEMLQN